MVNAASQTFLDFVSALERELATAAEPGEQVRATVSLLTGLLNRPDALQGRHIPSAPGHYARYRLHVDPQDRFCVVAMVWDPGQGTPIHDHGGVWCVEGLYQGELHITRFDLEQREGDTCRFRKVDDIQAHRCEVGNLIPPYEYHVMRNEGAQTAVSIHVYGRELRRCGRYAPHEDGVNHVRTECALGYDGLEG